MKTKRLQNLLRVLVATLIIAVICVSATACGEETSDDVSSVVGVYYYDAEGSEYLINLNDEAEFELSVRGETKDGKFELSGNSITLMVSRRETYNATYSNGTITLDYDGAQMNFIQKVNYTVTFNTFGGSNFAPVTVLNGKTVAQPTEEPTRNDGKDRFLGWYADEACNNQFNFNNPITGNTTVYAKWAEALVGQEEFVVNFDLNYEGADALTSMKTTGGKLYDVVAPSRSGYTFGGWWYSMYSDGTMLANYYEDEDVFNENTTLYAFWIESAEANKLSAPVVSVNNDVISWNAVSGASSYRVEISGPKGFGTIIKNVTATSEKVDFNDAPAGDYVVSVIAVSQDNTVSNSATVSRYYKNKSLARVSSFTVVEPAVLLFNGVENAEFYYITVECGDPEHNHTNVYNGKSTNYNFANCAMQEGGIVFTITAAADGYASSVSEKFVYNRVLEAVEEITFDEATETFKWNAVEKATGYSVTVTTADGAYTVDNGSATSFCVKNFNAGELTISVIPVTKGYNSPVATNYTYNKKTLASPTDICVEGTVVTWDEVEGATSYEVRVANQILPANTNSIDLASVYTWSRRENYTLTVRAKGASNSLWSEAFDFRYQSMYENLVYSESVVSWYHVLGAEYYEVKVNEEDAIIVGGGVNFAEVELNQAGENVVSVRFFDGEEYSEWASVSVYAYEVSFDTRSGKSLPSVFKAIGDKTELPNAERDGYVFAGWYNVPDGASGNGELFTDKTYTYSSATRLYAYWMPYSYNVSFNYGEFGVPADEETTVVYTRDFNFVAPQSTDETVVFAGWYTMPGGQGTRLTDEDGYSLDVWSIPTNTVVYANWLKVLEFTLIEGEEFYYSVKEGMGASLAYSITIPETYNGYPVREIGGNAFRGCNKLLTVNIPDSIYYIDVVGGAFSQCQMLKEINIYETENPSDMWYSHNGALIQNTEIDPMTLVFVPMKVEGTFEIGEGVKTIAPNVFYRSKITEVIIPATVTNIRVNAFLDSKNLLKVSFLSEEGQEDALTIERDAFANCVSLERIIMPKRVKGFGYDILTGESLGITSVFTGCVSLGYIDVEEGNPVYSSKDGMLIETYEDGTTALIYCPSARAGVVNIPVGIDKIGANAFENNKVITEVVLPDFVSEIGENAFKNCDNLVKVTFEKGRNNTPVTIGAYAFNDCNSLEEVVYEGNVVAIGEYAFNNCVRLNKVEIPSTITSVGEYAFNGCIKASEIEIAEEGEELSIGNAAFAGCARVRTVYLPARIVDFPNNAFPDCNKLVSVEVNAESEYYLTIDGVLYDKDVTEIKFYPKGKLGEYTIPETVVTIGEAVFRDNRNLKSIVIGKNVTSIEAFAFDGCSNLASVTFEEGGSKALTIGDNAFSRCTSLGEMVFIDRITAIGGNVLKDNINLATVTLSSGITAIGASAFSGVGFQSVEIPEGVVTIGDRAFEKTALTSVVLPNTVTFIGDYAFNGSKIESVTFSENLITIGAYAFASTPITSVVIPSSVESIGNYAFSSATKLVEVVFEEGEKDLTVGNYAFYKDTALSNVTLSSNVTVIGAYAFSQDTKLTNLVIPSDSRMKTIGNYAFQKCSITGEITLPNTLVNNGVTPAIGNSAFVNNTKLTKVNFATGGTGDFSIGHNAFQGCTSLNNVTLPARTAPIQGSSAGLTIFGVGNFGFNGCNKITAFSVEEGENTYMRTIDGILYADYGKTLVMVPHAMSAETITISGDITKIAPHAFYYIRNVKEVVFADNDNNVTMVETANNNYGAFTDSYIQRVTLPAKLQNIAAYTFYKATKITSIELPSEITKINKYAFYQSKITSFTIPASVTEIGDYAFRDATSATSFTFEEGSKLTKLGQYSLYKLNNITELVLPEGLVTIGNYALQQLSKVTKIVLPSTVTTISGSNVFSGCSKLKNVVVPDGLGSISNIMGKWTLEVLPTNKYYEKDEEGIIFTKAVNGITTTIVSFPTNYDGDSYEIPYGITEIGDNAFKDCSDLYSVTIPSTVTSIGKSAFKNCSSLEEITIPSSVTQIGNSAFSSCESLYDIIFEEGDANLEFGSYVFEYCYSLTSFVVPERVSDLGYGTFCSVPLEEFSFGDNNKIKYLGSSLFYPEDEEPSFTTLTIPASVEVIEDCVGGFSSLEEVRFEEGSQLREIWGDAFSWSRNLRVFEFPDSIEYFDEASMQNCALEEVVFGPNSNLTGLYYNSFSDNRYLKKVVLPASLTTIEGYAFENCPQLESVTIANGTTEIGDYAFSGCTALTKLNIGNTVEYIGDNAFSEAENLKELIIPASVTYIGEEAFYGCSNLETIIFEPGNENLVISDYAFEGCSSLLNLELPSRLVEMGESVFRGAESIESIYIPGSLSEISAYAFYGASNATSVEIASGVRVVGDFAFGECANLLTATIPDTVVEFGNNPFMGCFDCDVIISELNKELILDENGFLYNGLMTQLISVPVDVSGKIVIPEGVNEIAGGVFANCQNITEVVLPDTIVEINDNTFANSSITRITIGKNVTRVGRNAFENCENLEEVVFEEGGIDRLYIDSYAFANCVSLEEVVIPFRTRNYVAPNANDTSPAVGHHAFDGCVNLASVTFENEGAVTESISANNFAVGNYAFYNCDKLTSIVFPDHLYSQGGRAIIGIGEYAFANTSLSSVTFPDRPAIKQDYLNYKENPNNGFSLSNYTNYIIGAYAFANIEELTSITIPKDIRVIHDGAFTGTGLETVTIPANITYLHPYMFKNCTSLTSVSFVGTHAFIYDSLFEGCTALESVTFTKPDAIELVGVSAFKNCTSLTSLNLGNNVKKIRSNAFSGWTAEQTITFSAPFGMQNFESDWNANCNAVINNG